MEGIELFNTKQFFRCHEVVEALWKEERGHLRQFYQGLIQLAVGFYHLTRQNPAGASTLLQEGQEKLEPFAPHCLGIDVGELIRDIAACRRRLEELKPGRVAEFEVHLIPRIEGRAEP